MRAPSVGMVYRVCSLGCALTERCKSCIFSLTQCTTADTLTDNINFHHEFSVAVTPHSKKRWSPFLHVRGMYELGDA